jgi:hypothetical protein
MFTSFSGAHDGQWTVTSATAVRGAPLPPITRLLVSQTLQLPAQTDGWPLTGVASYVRYVQRPEDTALAARQAGLGRAEATCAALIPIAKSAAWWALTQEERREIFEARSHHIADSLAYLPAIARQLYHCRDLGGAFDFLTWFEFAPVHSDLFEELVRRLRHTEEWHYVEREVDLRLRREG